MQNSRLVYELADGKLLQHSGNRRHFPLILPLKFNRVQSVIHDYVQDLVLLSFQEAVVDISHACFPAPRRVPGCYLWRYLLRFWLDE